MEQIVYITKVKYAYSVESFNQLVDSMKAKEFELDSQENVLRYGRKYSKLIFKKEVV